MRLGLVGLAREEIEVGQPHPGRRPHRREVRGDLELALGLGGVALAQVEGAEGQMGLDGLQLLRHGLLESALRPRQVLLPEVQGAEHQVQLRAIPQFGLRRLDLPKGGIHLLGHGGHPGQQRKPVEVTGLSLEHEGDFPLALLPLAAEEVNRPELEPDVEVIGAELLALHEVAECLSGFAELVVQEAELPHRAGIGWLQAEHVLVLDQRLAVLLPRGVLVPALQVAAGLLGLRGAGAAGAEQQAERQEDRPATRRTGHGHGHTVFRLSRAGTRPGSGTDLEHT